MTMDTAIPLLRIVDQLNTEKLTRIQATVELMKMDLMNVEQKFAKGYSWFNLETTQGSMAKWCYKRRKGMTSENYYRQNLLNRIRWRQFCQPCLCHLNIYTGLYIYESYGHLAAHNSSK
ncbi:hypothetical protein CU097_002078 [Rhizopus azygosporus]|uniref:Uncharacterized protein n=1 Tax=Rhizopus azygosporus TaxID=86630 RepID=A0A367JN31_RHIAZ|nr:hypothetical protein CU097_002078 [Rhizopus azygosporus]